MAARAGQSRTKPSRPRVSFADRYALLFSKGRRVDGLWVGRFLGDPQVLDRVEEALRLIKTHDPLRYARLLRDVDRIWVILLPASYGTFDDALRACKLDERFVLAETSSPEMIAATIVHEATHARLTHCGMGYEGEEFRARVERVCFRRERAFAAKLPNGTEVRAQADSRLEGYPAEYWTDAAFEKRFLEGGVETLRHLGQPEWLIRIVIGCRRLRVRCVHLLARRPGNSGSG
jgi:hypothetical protein